MPKDAAGIFVHKVENWLWDLYQEMTGTEAVYVNEGDFGREIRTCVECFYWEKERHQWVNRKIDDERALRIIKTEVRERLANAATMQAGKEQYSVLEQMKFTQLYEYVREWLGEEKAGDETRKDGRTQELLDALKKIIERFGDREFE